MVIANDDGGQYLSSRLGAVGSVSASRTSPRRRHREPAHTACRCDRVMGSPRPNRISFTQHRRIAATSCSVKPSKNGVKSAIICTSFMGSTPPNVGSDLVVSRLLSLPDDATMQQPLVAWKARISTSQDLTVRPAQDTPPSEAVCLSAMVIWLAPMSRSDRDCTRMGRDLRTRGPSRSPVGLYVVLWVID
jgi:hypothetical protein